MCASTEQFHVKIVLKRCAPNHMLVHNAGVLLLT